MHENNPEWVAVRKSVNANINFIKFGGNACDICSFRCDFRRFFACADSPHRVYSHAFIHCPKDVGDALVLCHQLLRGESEHFLRLRAAISSLEESHENAPSKWLRYCWFHNVNMWTYSFIVLFQWVFFFSFQVAGCIFLFHWRIAIFGSQHTIQDCLQA